MEGARRSHYHLKSDMAWRRPDCRHPLAMDHAHLPVQWAVSVGLKATQGAVTSNPEEKLAYNWIYNSFQ